MSNYEHWWDCWGGCADEDHLADGIGILESYANGEIR